MVQPFNTFNAFHRLLHQPSSCTALCWDCFRYGVRTTTHKTVSTTKPRIFEMVLYGHRADNVLIALQFVFLDCIVHATREAEGRIQVQYPLLSEWIRRIGQWLLRRNIQA